MSDSDCIAFLEQLGAGGIAREASQAELERLLTEAGIDGEAGAAILAGDAHSLAYLLGASPTVCCLIAPGKEDEEEEEEDDDEDDEDDEDEDDEDEDEDEDDEVDDEEEADQEAESLAARQPSRNLAARRARCED